MQLITVYHLFFLSTWISASLPLGAFASQRERFLQAV